MPRSRPHTKPDFNQRIVRAVDALTGSEPVKGEDLLPPHLAKQLREAKAADAARGVRRLRRKVKL